MDNKRGPVIRSKKTNIVNNIVQDYYRKLLNNERSNENTVDEIFSNSICLKPTSMLFAYLAADDSTVLLGGFQPPLKQQAEKKAKEAACSACSAQWDFQEHASELTGEELPRTRFVWLCLKLQHLTPAHKRQG